MSSLCLVGDPVSPIELFKYDIAVTPHSHVASELTGVKRFLQGMDEYKDRIRNCIPKRPSLTLLSRIFDQDGAKPTG